MSDKVIACGCVRLVTGNQLGDWKGHTVGGVTLPIACPDHWLAAITAKARRAFPRREAGTMPIAARRITAQLRYANEYRPNMADAIVNEFWERVLP